MPAIKKIHKLEEAKPQKGLWFDYYGKIFISVIPTNYRPYIRSKAEIDDGKNDNKMSAWHSEWQFGKIENSYGLSVGKKRTFEIAIDVDGERHIIDSLVKNLAIEFQHSLGVSIEEMNSRYLAHKKAGFMPYLVLDLTEYPLKEYLTFDSKVVSKLLKWKECEYMKAGNLFADLSDCIVRFSEKVYNNHLQIPKATFLNSLLDLEIMFIHAIQKECVRKEEEEIIWKEKQKLEEKRRLEIYAEQLERDREAQKIEKKNSPDFKYFRKCLEDKLIRPLIAEIENEVIKFTYFEKEEEDDILEKEYFYLSKESFSEISYINVFRIKDGWRKDFDHSRVEIKCGGKEHLFHIQYGKTEMIY